MFIFIKCLCTSCGHELLITRCRGHILKLGLLSNLDFYLAKAAIAAMGGGGGGVAMGVS